MGIMKKFVFIVVIVLLCGCTLQENHEEDHDGNNEIVSENQTEEQLEEQPDTLSENAGQSVSSDAGQAQNLSENEAQAENEAQEEDDGTYYTMEEVKALGIPEDMLAYWMVLNSKMPFISANEGCQEFFWDEYFWCLSEPIQGVEVSDFGIVDLDNDGSEELVITIGFPGATQVLDYQEGEVYGYSFPFRGMKRIDVNGVFDGSSAADINGFYRIVYFDKGTYEEETLVYMNKDYFEVEGVEVSEEEFNEYTRTLRDAELMQRWDFSEEMLNEALLGNLGTEELSMVQCVEPEEICDENNPQMADVPDAYLAVLNGKEEFVCVTREGQNFIIDGIYIRNQAGAKAYQIFYFSVVDMDGDGESEVILTCDRDNLVLHAEEGAVYGYTFDFWGEMGAIAKDGVFETRYQYEETYGKIVSFDNEGCGIEIMEDYGNINDNRIRYYYFSEELD